MRMAAVASATEISARGDREIVMTRTFDAPREIVFEAHARPEHLRAWMRGPDGWRMPVCEMDFRPGGGWLLGWRGPDGALRVMSGEFQEIGAPERIVVAESRGDGWPATLTSIALAAGDGGTELTARILYPSRAARDAAFTTRMRREMSAAHDRLAALLPTIGWG
ncbi:MAG TPA: SRPBCC domain-containing protein [Longimicrobium sp.]|jgi:uncharacterized protein YndB with AHSA1/START domain